MGTGSTSELSAVRFVAAAGDGRVLGTRGDECLTETRFVIDGMHDDACARCIEGAIALIGGERVVRVSLSSRTAWVVFDSARVREWQFERAVRAMGYRLESRHAAPGSLGWDTHNEVRSKQWNG
jgi:copper chaperone CopZ